MEISTAASRDSETLASLERACFSEPWSEPTIAAALSDEKYLILLMGDGPSSPGYALGWSVGEEAELARVGVLQNRRGQGIGEKLTCAMLQAFQPRGVRSVFLEVRASNFAARRLYVKCGFVEIGKRKNYYADGEDAIVMRAILPSHK